MSYLEHEEGLDLVCGCPTCDMTSAYLEKYKVYKAAKMPYRVIDEMYPVELEKKMNELQAQGYEVSSHVGTIVIMRLLPPIAPTVTDIVIEQKAREKETPSFEGEDTIGDTMGPMQ